MADEPENLLVDTHTAAQRLNVSPHTMKAWRRQGKGPRYTKLNGKLVRYFVHGLYEYAAGNEPKTLNQAKEVAKEVH